MFNISGDLPASASQQANLEESERDTGQDDSRPASEPSPRTHTQDDLVHPKDWHTDRAGK